MLAFRRSTRVRFSVTRSRRSISAALSGYSSRLDPLFATDLDQVSILRSNHRITLLLRGPRIRLYSFSRAKQPCIRERNCNAHFRHRHSFLLPVLGPKTVNPSSGRRESRYLTDFPRRDPLVFVPVIFSHLTAYRTAAW